MKDFPVPKFKLGDKVWRAYNSWSSTPRECAVCRGEWTLSAVHPSNIMVVGQCPRCNGKGNDGKYSFAAKVSYLTIGGVSVCTWNKPEVITYMCEETGVGTGTIHPESTLFFDEEEARAKSQEFAKQSQDSLEASIADVSKKARKNNS